MPSPHRLQAFIAAVEQGDTVAALRAFYAPQASQQENLAPPRRGLEQLIAHETAQRHQVSDLSMRCTEPPLQQGDRVAIRWSLRWRRDGRSHCLEELALQRWDGEHIVEEQFVYDPSQLGAAPPRIRVATRDDVTAIQGIRAAVKENRLVSRRIGDDEVIEHLERHGRGWVAEWMGGIAGFAIGDARDGNIWALFVDPACEGRGAGRLLHDSMVDWLFAQGLPRLHLGTEPGTRAERFYRQRGWTALGVSHGEQQFEMHRR